MTVWLKAALYSPEKGTASSWIFAIACNVRIDRLRRERSWQALTDEQANSITSEDIAPDVAVSDREWDTRLGAVRCRIMATAAPS